MFQIRLADMDSPRKLTQSVLQAMQLLGLYQAELARILGVNCADVGELANAQRQLLPGSESWTAARAFIQVFELLYTSQRGDEVAMRHWLRADNPGLGGTPLLVMVDELRIDDVIQLLRQLSSD